MIALYTHYKNGYLPAAGGILDQASIFVQAMQALDAELNRIPNEKTKQDSDRR